ncbi:MAG: class I SAM-dependent methyltransferase [Thermodesulfovibrionales bacterium]|nr:class I SAM-dependent methyltransferase [Thermodesulfovibrionales bacterium]
MDLKDRLQGLTPEHFWFRGKMDLLEVLLQRAVSSFLKDTPRPSILSIGAGTGENLATAAKCGDVSALDIDQEALDLIPEGLVKEKTRGDACHLPYGDGSFDMVLALDVLEHIEDNRAAVAEIRRVLKPGGTVICTVPAHPYLFGAHDRGLGHARRFTMRSTLALFEGLDVCEAGHWMFFLLPAAFVQRMAQRNTQKGSKAMLPGFINGLLYRVLKLESVLIGHGVRFPTGLSIYLTARKQTP